MFILKNCFHLKTKRIRQHHTAKCLDVLDAETVLSSSSSVWTDYLERVCHIQPPVNIQACCAPTALWLHWTGNTPREPSCWLWEARGRGLRQTWFTSFVCFCGSSSLTRSSWSMCSAGAQSVILIKGLIQRNMQRYVVYTVITPTAGESTTLWRCKAHYVPGNLK